ncbi:ANK1 [Symbiodinium sp. CCMP2592]|nr:ANK1 [Symbiodinium sp. CCMP2592]
MSYRKDHREAEQSTEDTEARTRFIPLSRSTWNSTPVCQATDARQKVRDFLGAHLFRAWCSANVSKWTYADVPSVSEIAPEQNQCPSEETVREVLSGISEVDKTPEGTIERDAFILDSNAAGRPATGVRSSATSMGCQAFVRKTYEAKRFTALHIAKELLAWLHTIELLRQASAPGSNAVKQRSWRKKGRKKKHAPGGLPPKPATVGHYRVPEDGPKKRTTAEHSEQNCSGSAPKWEAAPEDLCQDTVPEDGPKKRTAAEHSEQNCSGSAPKWEAAPEDLCQVPEGDPKKRTTAEHSEQNCSGSAPKWEAAPEDLCQDTVPEDGPKKRTAAEHSEQNCSGSAPKWEAAPEDLCQVPEGDPKKRTTAEHSEQNCSGSAPKWEAAPEDICQEKVSEDDPNTEAKEEDDGQQFTYLVPKDPKATNFLQPAMLCVRASSGRAICTIDPADRRNDEGQIFDDLAVIVSSHLGVPPSRISIHPVDGHEQAPLNPTTTWADCKQLVATGDYELMAVVRHYRDGGVHELSAAIEMAHADVDGKHFGTSPLVAACETRNIQMAGFLIQAGANVNRPTWWRDTPLLIAASIDSLPLVRLLLQNHANVNQQGPQQRGPIEEAFQSDAVRVATRLVRAKAQVQPYTDDNCLLHQAGSRGSITWVKLLIRAGADPQNRDQHGRLPLDVRRRLPSFQQRQQLRRSLCPAGPAFTQHEPTPRERTDHAYE